jgi:hypothetical protein
MGEMWWEQHGQHGQHGHALPTGRAGTPGKADARPTAPDAASPAAEEAGGDAASVMAEPVWMPRDAQFLQSHPPATGAPIPTPDETDETDETTANPAASLPLPYDGEVGPAETALGSATAGQDAAWELRVHTRQLIREFLRSVPRAEEQTTLPLITADGRARLVTRGQMSAAIDRMRPRMRQVVHLTLEEGWSRQRVCAYLRNFSMKTLERDQVEGLDLLTDL